MKKVLAILLTAAIIGATLTGCGGKKEETETPAAPAEIEESENNTDNTDNADDITAFDAAAHADANLPDASGDPEVVIIFSGGSFQALNESEAVFKNAVEELSGGSIKIDWHPMNELGGDLDIITQVSFGDVDMGLTSPSAVTTMMPNLALFDSYYLINDQETAYAVMDGEIGDKLAADAEELNMKLVAWCENGFRNLTVKGNEVHTMADLKGRKIRTMENQLQMAAWTALGANPTPMTFGEVFTAMQQGAIDGQENPLGIIASNSFMDVQDHLVLSQHVYTPIAIYINMDKYNSMTDNQKAVFDYCMEYMEKWERERNLELNQQIVEDFKANGVNVIELEDSAITEFRNAIEEAGVYEKVRDTMTNPELLDKLMEMSK